MPTGIFSYQILFQLCSWDAWLNPTRHPTSTEVEGKQPSDRLAAMKSVDVTLEVNLMEHTPHTSLLSYTALGLKTRRDV